MKNKAILSVMAIAFAVMMVSSVSAVAGANFNSIGLTTKDSADWSEVSGATGTLSFWQDVSVKYVKGVKTTTFKDRFSLNAMGEAIVPNQKYTLIYYGDKDNNDVYPFATCIATGTAKAGTVKVDGIWNKVGTVSLTGFYKYSNFLDDGEDQKFWLVKTSDVNCAKKQMKAWNPDKYLFEQNTI